MTDKSQEVIDAASQVDAIIAQLEVITKEQLMSGTDERALLAALSIHLGQTMAIVLSAIDANEEMVEITKGLVAETIKQTFSQCFDIAKVTKAKFDAKMEKENV